MEVRWCGGGAVVVRWVEGGGGIGGVGGVVGEEWWEGRVGEGWILGKS